MLLGAALVALSIQLAHNYLDHEEPAPTPSTETHIHIDANGVPHGQAGHDHGSMLQEDEAAHKQMAH